MLNRVLFIVFVLALFGCNVTSDCTTYECRRKSIKIYLDPNEIGLGESSTLIVEREKLYLPHMRVFIGDYDSEFNLSKNISAQYFEGTDSLASIVLAPESLGQKKIRGIIEEYKIVSKDSIDSYRYRFEVELIVK